MSDDRAIEVIAEALWGSFIDNVPWGRAGTAVSMAYRERARMSVEALASAGFQITDLTSEEEQLAVNAFDRLLWSENLTDEWRTALEPLRAKFARRLSGANDA